MVRRMVGSRGDVMTKGNLIYGDDGGTTQYPVLSDTARVKGTDTNGAAPIVVSSKEEFIFYPGASELASTSTITGMVLSGVRKGSATVTTASSASTYWSADMTYAPLFRGKIDGAATGGIISGQITIGVIGAAAATADAKLTARIRNNGGTWTTCLFLSATVIAVGGTTEVYKTYDISHLLTTADFNAVPFNIAIGAQSDKAAASCAVIARVMESSYIQGWVEPTT